MVRAAPALGQRQGDRHRRCRGRRRLSARERFAEQGAVVLRGLLPPRSLEPLRDGLVAVLADAGIVEPDGAGQPSGPPVPAVRMARAGRTARAGEAPGAGLTGALRPGPAAREVDPVLYRRLFAVPALHELAHQAPLAALARALLGVDDVLVHPRPACRVVLPVDDAGGPPPTPAHQDHLGMQGSTAALTVWVPLVDCPRRMGPVSVALGSHLLGRRPYRPAPSARVLSCDDADLVGRWASSDLRVGDVVVFHALSVHRALPNCSDRVRLSVDFRCQPAVEPVCELTVREDPAQPWDEAYAGLRPGSPATAWRTMPLRLVPFDRSVLAGR